VVRATVEVDLRHVARLAREGDANGLEHAVDDAIGLRTMQAELPLQPVRLDVDRAESGEVASERECVCLPVDPDPKRLRGGPRSEPKAWPACPFLANLPTTENRISSFVTRFGIYDI